MAKTKQHEEKKRIDLQIQALRKERSEIWKYLFSDEALALEMKCKKGDPFEAENQRIEDIEDELEQLRKQSRELYCSMIGADVSKIESYLDLVKFDYCG